MTIVAKAKYLGPDERGRDQRGCCAVIELNGVRFFSLTPADREDAERINAAMAEAQTRIKKMRDWIGFTPHQSDGCTIDRCECGRNAMLALSAEGQS